MRKETLLPIESPQTIKEGYLKRSFDNLLENLGLGESGLREKRILDIGAGERYLAAYCRKAGINDDVFSVEPNLGISSHDSEFVKKNWPEIDNLIGKKTVVAKRENLPFEDESFDLAINHAALPGKMYFKDGNYELMEEAIGNSFDEMMRILKSGGEAIIFPLEFYPKEKTEQYKPYKEALERKIAGLAEAGICTVQMERIEKEITNNKGAPEKRLLTRIILKKN